VSDVEVKDDKGRLVAKSLVTYYLRKESFFDKVDLGVEAIGNWREFEKKFYEGGK